MRVGAVNLCVEDGSTLLKIAATPEMLDASEGYRNLALVYKEMTGKEVPKDNVIMALCPQCDNTYLWVGDGPPRITLVPYEQGS